MNANGLFTVFIGAGGFVHREEEEEEEETAHFEYHFGILGLI